MHLTRRTTEVMFMRMSRPLYTLVRTITTKGLWGSRRRFLFTAKAMEMRETLYFTTIPENFGEGTNLAA